MSATRASSGVAVVGLGNVLMRDDGFGVHVVDELERKDPIPGVEVWDFGTSPLDMLGVFLDHDKVIVVDAVRAGHAPGTVYRFTPEHLSAGPDGGMSSHDTRLLDLIGMARMMGSAPEVVIYGAEPEEITVALGLSACAEAAMEQVAQLVAYEAQYGFRMEGEGSEASAVRVFAPEGTPGGEG